MKTYVIKNSKGKGKKWEDLTMKEKEKLLKKVREAIKSVLKVCEILEKEKKNKSKNKGGDKE